MIIQLKSVQVNNCVALDRFLELNLYVCHAKHRLANRRTLFHVMQKSDEWKWIICMRDCSQHFALSLLVSE